MNYLPKARVLARSLRHFHADATIHLVVCDILPPSFSLADEPFDRVWTLDDLPVPREPSWRFDHSLVELSTAVKGFALIEILRLPDVESVLYFDPDIVVLAPMHRLLEEFVTASILLTPHSTVPDLDGQTLRDGELVALRHGVFNLGFLGVKNDEEGNRFAAWWRDRLRDFCFDDPADGLFTDQRWADLVPSFFPSHRILTSAAYNVCTWNLKDRNVTGSLTTGLLVNGESLVFYHFSGFDSGAQQTMLDRYGKHMPALYELRRWYETQLRMTGERSIPWAFGFFANGDPITVRHRKLYRKDARVRAMFPDPYAAEYSHWYRLNHDEFELERASPHPQLSLQLYWDHGQGFEEQASVIRSPRGMSRQQLRLPIPAVQVRRLRLDVAKVPSVLCLYDLHIGAADGTQLLPVVLSDTQTFQQLVPLQSDGCAFRLAALGFDAHLDLPLSQGMLQRLQHGGMLVIDAAWEELDASELFQAVNEERERLALMLSSMKQSRSWKLTEPLRRFALMLTALRK